jgi:hypothetical protein
MSLLFEWSLCHIYVLDVSLLVVSVGDLWETFALHA